MTHSNDDHLGRVQGLDSDLGFVFFFSGGNEIRCFADLRGEGRDAAGLRGGCFHFAHTVLRPPLPSPLLPPGGFHSHFHMVQTVLSAARQQVLRGGLLWELGNETG